MSHERKNGGGSTAIRVGKYTPSSYYSGARTESYRCPPCKTVKQPGGHSARVLKSPPRGR